ncbi:MAG: hypothetical protein IH977_09745 [Nitrospinae bacterium]|nr:hypothetical protein [Nitrospinota bacterium]
MCRSKEFLYINARQDVQKAPLACAKPLSAFVATSAKEARRSQVQQGRFRNPLWVIRYA